MTEIPLKKYAIIVAGGSGTRMNTPVPKQFLKLDGKPVLMHTISKFADLPAGQAGPGMGIEIILVLNKDSRTYWEELCKEHGFRVDLKIVDGGETRFQSVKNGLALVTQDSFVAVHDAVRPLVSAKTISTAFKAAELWGNAVPAIPLSDSIRQIDSTLSIAVDRAKYCIIQTPQVFHSKIIKKAYSKEYKFNFTDDASVVESIGEKIRLIDGNPDNIKITKPQDLIVAEALLKHKPMISAK